VLQQCELIGVKTNLDKGFNFYVMGEKRRRRRRRKEEEEKKKKSD